MISARDNYNEDISEFLSAVDENYLAMPSVGDYFIVEFEAPDIDKNLTRTIFLKSTGYYEIHLPKDQPMQTQKIVRNWFSARKDCGVLK